MDRRSLRHLGTALLLLVAFVCQGTWALASVTGGLTRNRRRCRHLGSHRGSASHRHQPVAIARRRRPTRRGHFTFLTLAPDTYTVTAAKSGYQAASVPGQTVFADTVQTVSVRMPKSLKTIAHVTATAGRRAREIGHDRRRLLDQRSPAGRDRRARRRRPHQPGILRDLDRSGRVCHSEPKRVLRDDQHSRRRLRPSRL